MSVTRLRRDGSVMLDGEIIGRVFGEPRDWGFMLADGREPTRTPASGWHSKNEAASMCVRAHQETPPRDARTLAYIRLRVHLSKVSELAARGNVPAALMVLDDVARDLDDIQQAIDTEGHEENRTPTCAGDARD